jgi:hypothetical protein
MEETQPKLLNIALIGAQGVGKSALKNKFSNVPIDCDGQAVTLNILESPAETDKTKIDAVLLVCDTNDENAKTKAEEKVLEIKQRYGNDIKIIIVGNYEDNKSDNFASVSAGLRQVAKNGKREYISTSAKTGFQVDYAFSSLARVALDLKPKAPPLTESALAGVLEIKRDGALSYLEKLQRIKGKFGLFDFDKSVMSQLFSGESLGFSEDTNKARGLIQGYEGIFGGNYSNFSNIHETELSAKKQELIKLAPDEVDEKISAIESKEGAVSQKLDALKKLYFDYQGFCDVPERAKDQIKGWLKELIGELSGDNIARYEKVIGAGQLVGYKQDFSWIGPALVDEIILPEEKKLEQAIRDDFFSAVQKEAAKDVSSLEKLKAILATTQKYYAVPFLRDDRLKEVIESILKQNENAVGNNDLMQLSELRELMFLCKAFVELDIQKQMSVFKLTHPKDDLPSRDAFKGQEIITQLQFDALEQICAGIEEKYKEPKGITAEMERILSEEKPPEEKLDHLNLLLSLCLKNNVSLPDELNSRFKRELNSLSEQIAKNLILKSRELFLNLDIKELSKNYELYDQRSIALQDLVERMILKNSDSGASVLAIKQWLFVLDKCRNEGDYYTAHVIMDAFDRVPVREFFQKHTLVKEKDIYNQYRKLFTPPDYKLSVLAMEEASEDKVIVPSLYAATQLIGKAVANKGTTENIVAPLNVAQAKLKANHQKHSILSEDSLSKRILAEEERKTAAVGVGAFDVMTDREVKALVEFVAPLEVLELASRKNKALALEKMEAVAPGRNPLKKFKKGGASDIEKRLGEIKPLLDKAVLGNVDATLKNKLPELIVMLEKKLAGREKSKVEKPIADVEKAAVAEKAIAVMKQDLNYLRAFAKHLKIEFSSPVVSEKTSAVQAPAPATGNFFSRLFGRSKQAAPVPPAVAEPAKAEMAVTKEDLSDNSKLPGILKASREGNVAKEMAAKLFPQLSNAELGELAKKLFPIEIFQKEGEVLRGSSLMTACLKELLGRVSPNFAKDSVQSSQSIQDEAEFLNKFFELIPAEIKEIMKVVCPADASDAKQKERAENLIFFAKSYANEGADVSNPAAIQASIAFAQRSAEMAVVRRTGNVPNKAYTDFLTDTVYPAIAGTPVPQVALAPQPAPAVAAPTIPTGDYILGNSGKTWTDYWAAFDQKYNAIAMQAEPPFSDYLDIHNQLLVSTDYRYIQRDPGILEAIHLTVVDAGDKNYRINFRKSFGEAIASNQIKLSTTAETQQREKEAEAQRQRDAAAPASLANDNNAPQFKSVVSGAAPAPEAPAPEAPAPEAPVPEAPAPEAPAPEAPVPEAPAPEAPVSNVIVAGLDGELTNLNEKKLADFSNDQTSRQMSKFTQNHPADSGVVALGNEYATVFALLAEIKGLTESDPVDRALHIAALLQKTDGKDGYKAIMRYEQALGIVRNNEKYEPELYGKNPDPKAEAAEIMRQNAAKQFFQQALPMPYQWLPRYVLHFERYNEAKVFAALDSGKQEKVKEALGLFKKIAVQTNEYKRLLDKFAELKPYETETAKAAELNKQFDSVHKGLELFLAEKLSAAEKPKLVEEIDKLIKAYADRIKEKAEREGGVIPKDPAKIKLMLGNVSSLLYLSSQVDPAHKNTQLNRDVWAVLGTVQVALPEFDAKCQEILVQVGAKTVEKKADAKGEEAKPGAETPTVTKTTNESISDIDDTGGQESSEQASVVTAEEFDQLIEAAAKKDVAAIPAAEKELTSEEILENLREGREAEEASKRLAEELDTLRETANVSPISPTTEDQKFAAFMAEEIEVPTPKPVVSAPPKPSVVDAKIIQGKEGKDFTWQQYWDAYDAHLETTGLKLEYGKRDDAAIARSLAAHKAACAVCDVTIQNLDRLNASIFNSQPEQEMYKAFFTKIVSEQKYAKPVIIQATKEIIEEDRVNVTPPLPASVELRSLKPDSGKAELSEGEDLPPRASPGTPGVFSDEERERNPFEDETEEAAQPGVADLPENPVLRALAKKNPSAQPQSSAPMQEEKPLSAKQTATATPFTSAPSPLFNREDEEVAAAQKKSLFSRARNLFRRKPKEATIQTEAQALEEIQRMVAQAEAKAAGAKIDAQPQKVSDVPQMEEVESAEQLLGEESEDVLIPVTEEKKKSFLSKVLRRKGDAEEGDISEEDQEPMREVESLFGEEVKEMPLREIPVSPSALAEKYLYMFEGMMPIPEPAGKKANDKVNEVLIYLTEPGEKDEAGLKAHVEQLNVLLQELRPKKKVHFAADASPKLSELQQRVEMNLGMVDAVLKNKVPEPTMPASAELIAPIPISRPVEDKPVDKRVAGTKAESRSFSLRDSIGNLAQSLADSKSLDEAIKAMGEGKTPTDKVVLVLIAQPELAGKAFKNYGALFTQEPFEIATMIVEGNDNLRDAIKTSGLLEKLPQHWNVCLKAMLDPEHSAGLLKANEDVINNALRSSGDRDFSALISDEVAGLGNLLRQAGVFTSNAVSEVAPSSTRARTIDKDKEELDEESDLTTEFSEDAGGKKEVEPSSRMDVEHVERVVTEKPGVTTEEVRRAEKNKIKVEMLDAFEDIQNPGLKEFLIGHVNSPKFDIQAGRFIDKDWGEFVTAINAHFEKPDYIRYVQILAKYNAQDLFNFDTEAKFNACVSAVVEDENDYSGESEQVVVRGPGQDYSETGQKKVEREEDTEEESEVPIQIEEDDDETYSGVSVSEEDSKDKGELSPRRDASLEQPPLEKSAPAVDATDRQNLARKIESNRLRNPADPIVNPNTRLIDWLNGYTKMQIVEKASRADQRAYQNLKPYQTRQVPERHATFFKRTDGVVYLFQDNRKQHYKESVESYIKKNPGSNLSYFADLLVLMNTIESQKNTALMNILIESPNRVHVTSVLLTLNKLEVLLGKQNPALMEELTPVREQFEAVAKMIGDKDTLSPKEITAIDKAVQNIDLAPLQKIRAMMADELGNSTYQDLSSKRVMLGLRVFKDWNQLCNAEVSLALTNAQKTVEFVEQRYNSLISNLEQLGLLSPELKRELIQERDTLRENPLANIEFNSRGKVEALLKDLFKKDTAEALLEDSNEGNVEDIGFDYQEPLYDFLLSANTNNDKAKAVSDFTALHDKYIRNAAVSAEGVPVRAGLDTMASHLSDVLTVYGVKPGQSRELLAAELDSVNFPAEYRGTVPDGGRVEIRVFAAGERNAFNTSDIKKRINFLADVAKEFEGADEAQIKEKIEAIRAKYLGGLEKYDGIHDAEGKYFEVLAKQAKLMFMTMQKELVHVVLPNVTKLSAASKAFEKKAGELIVARGRPTVIHVMADGRVNAHIPTFSSKDQKSYPSTHRADERGGINPNSVFEFAGRIKNGQVIPQAGFSRAVSFSVLKLVKAKNKDQRLRLNDQNAEAYLQNNLRLRDFPSGSTIYVQSTSLLTPSPIERVSATILAFFGWPSETRQAKDHHRTVMTQNTKNLPLEDGRDVNIRACHVNFSVKPPRGSGLVNYKVQDRMNNIGMPEYFRRQYESLMAAYPNHPEVKNWLDQNCYRQPTQAISDLEAKLQAAYVGMRTDNIDLGNPKGEKAKRKAIDKLETELAEKYSELYAGVKKMWQAGTVPPIPVQDTQLNYLAEVLRLYHSGQYKEAGYSYMLTSSMGRTNEFAGVVEMVNCKSANDRTFWEVFHELISIKYENEHDGRPLRAMSSDFMSYMKANWKEVYEQAVGLFALSYNRPGARGSVVDMPWKLDPSKKNSLVSKMAKAKYKPVAILRYAQEIRAELSEMRRNANQSPEDAALEQVNNQLLESMVELSEDSVNAENVLRVAGIDNPVIAEALVFSAANVGAALPDDLSPEASAINQLLPAASEMPDDILINYRKFLEIVKDIPFINDMRPEFIAAVVTQGMPIRFSSFRQGMANIPSFSYEQLTDLKDNIQIELRKLEGMIENFGNAIRYLDDKVTAGVENEVKVLEEKYAKMRELQGEFTEDLRLIDAKQAEIQQEIDARLSPREESPRARTASVSRADVEEVADMSVRPRGVSAEEARKGDVIEVIVYSPEKDEGKRFKSVENPEAINKLLSSDNKHMIQIKENSISYTAPDAAEKLNPSEMKEFVQKMVEEAFKKFNTPENPIKNVDDLAFDGSKELKRLAAELMKAEIIKHAPVEVARAAGPAAAAAPDSPESGHPMSKH